jgi:hypothetical protein
MALRATITGRISNNVVTVAKAGGALSAAAPGVSLKNQVNEIRSIEDIADVVRTNPVNGATLVYNASLDKYEVKPIDLGATGLDGGTF